MSLAAASLRAQEIYPAVASFQTTPRPVSSSANEPEPVEATLALLAVLREVHSALRIDSLRSHTRSVVFYSRLVQQESTAASIRSIALPPATGQYDTLLDVSVSPHPLATHHVAVSFVVHADSRPPFPSHFDIERD